MGIKWHYIGCHHNGGGCADRYRCQRFFRGIVTAAAAEISAVKQQRNKFKRTQHAFIFWGS